ncbi:SUN domain-containing protein 1-like [Silene latifolia]|uniref:SUN domain-containing protein 1-like n=1 Tax=Silene latifolia TaxID=37657 RepID=UPI003D77C497
MSTSAISATTNSRHRPSPTISDIKQSIDIVNATTATKNPSQFPQTRTRTRKHSKPRWKRIFNVVVKNVLLVIMVLGLLQLVRKLGGSDDVGGGNVGFSDLEGRIASVEASMKSTSKMVEVELGVVEKKIESEVGNLRREIGRRVEDKIEVKLDEFGGKYEDLEVELRELREVSKGFVSKDDVIRMYDELVSGNGGSGEATDVSLDDVRGLAREIVEKEIEKHAADGVGRVDYALASGGARVVRHSEPLMAGKGKWFGGSREGVHESAVRMLRPSFGEPGMCFALKGSSGFVEIRLRTAIVPEAVTLEHVAKNVAYDQSSAPKDFRVFGWLHGEQAVDMDSNVDNEKALVGELRYDLEKSNAQTFNTLNSAESIVIDTVRLELRSNHGSPTHTCIYRLRVHGHVPDVVHEF